MTHNNPEERSVEDWEREFEELYGDDFAGGFRDKLKSFIHHQLQKARQDWLREEIVRLEGMINTNEADGHAHDPARAYEEGCNDTLKTIIDRYQTELDQDKKLQNCIECGEPVPESESVKNCHGTCRLEI